MPACIRGAGKYHETAIHFRTEVSESVQSIVNCRVISPDLDIADARVRIEGKRIAVVTEGGSLASEGEVVDAGGRWLVPGFIDIHTHGANGFDTSDGSGEHLRGMAEAKLREGVTTFLPTTLTLPPDRLEEVMRGVAEYQAGVTHAKAPLVHIEGPFINPKCAGAQNPAFVRCPDVREIDKLHAIAPVGIVSLAVEQPGGVAFVAAMKERGITSSLAHTAATYADFAAAKAAGLKHLTHFCNQMTGLHHREIGIVGAGLMDDEILIELICDKIHLCPDMLKLVWKLKPADQLMIITDSMSASWLPDGTYGLGGLNVHVKDRQARLENGALAGSTALYFEEFRNILDVTGLPPATVIKATSWNQARSLGLEGVGKIERGFLADLVLLDPHTCKPEVVWVEGVRKV